MATVHGCWASNPWKLPLFLSSVSITRRGPRLLLSFYSPTQNSVPLPFSWQRVLSPLFRKSSLEYFFPNSLALNVSKMPHAASACWPTHGTIRNQHQARGHSMWTLDFLVEWLVSSLMLEIFLRSGTMTTHGKYYYIHNKTKQKHVYP